MMVAHNSLPPQGLQQDVLRRSRSLLSLLHGGHRTADMSFSSILALRAILCHRVQFLKSTRRIGSEVFLIDFISYLITDRYLLS